jgi:hypothetical protein
LSSVVFTALSVVSDFEPYFVSCISLIFCYFFWHESGGLADCDIDDKYSIHLPESLLMLMRPKWWGTIQMVADIHLTKS